MDEELGERLQELSLAVGVDLGADAGAALLRFLALLLAANLKLSLTAIRDPQEALVKHLADSLAGLDLVRGGGGAVVDVGSGGGLPGIPLAVCSPGREFVLVEASRKKVAYLQATVRELGLDNVRVWWRRVEAVGQGEGRERFGVAVVRAVTSLAVVYEYCLPLLAVGGRLVAWRGRQAEVEMEAARGVAEKLGGGPARLHPYSLAGAGERGLVVVEKVGPTPARFPRRVGVPERRPLA